jgi:hypothetical protein
MAKISQEKEELIIKLFQEKKYTKVFIAQQCQCSVDTVTRVLQRNNLMETKLSKKLLDIYDNVVSDYQKGEYCKDLAKKYSVDEHSIYKILNKAGIKRQTGYHSKCNENYFEKIDTPDKAYLLGFITADGAVVNEVLSIEIQNDDIDLLLYAKQQINPDATITPCKGRNTSKVTFGAKQIGRDLAKYGIVQNKSKIIKKVPKELIPRELLKFYFRGLIDGDGCVLQNGRLNIYSGSRDFIEDVQNILIEEVQLTPLSIYEGTTYFISWSSKIDKEKLFHYLYDDLDKCFYYKRKYKRLYESLNHANTEVTL